ncbi:MAG: carboxypeptidase regulatory-like domain-containing protein [Deltaproteobacteria bacterium]|nr:carboxypeptidase regulatory-like domain-containing protein [Deltaproteobacteria bacterium]
MPRFALAALIPLVFSACRGDPDQDTPPPLPLDERLAPGQARAGVVTKAEELLTGITAKGRIGDLKIYNSKIAVVIGQTGFARGYNPYGGTIVDADIVRAPGATGHTTFGEIITSFDLQVLKPEKLEVLQDGRDGGPAVVRMTGVLADLPLLTTLLSALITREERLLTVDVDYILEPDSDALKIQYTLYNAGLTSLEIGLPILGFMFGDGAQPFTPGYGFDKPASGRRVEYFSAVAPEVSYFFGRGADPISFLVSESGLHLGTAGDVFTLRAHERKVTTDVLVVGDGDLSRSQAQWRKVNGKPAVTPVTGRVTRPDGAAVAGARVHVTDPTPEIQGREYVTMTRTDAEGRFRFEAPEGALAITVATDARVISDAKPIQVAANLPAVDVVVGVPGRVHYQITDTERRPLPAKLSFVHQGGLSGHLPERYGEELHPGSTFRVVHAIHGEGTVELPPGSYTVYVSRGAEYEVVEGAVTVTSDQESPFSAALDRSVDTSGWISTDTHLHSQLSPDSSDLFEFKVSALVTEGLEMPVSTEHEAIGDFNPAIRALDLEGWMQGVLGSEVTTFTYGHFNAFPLVQDFAQPGNGRVDWVSKMPGPMFAAIRANPGQPFIQVNHPRSAAIGGYFSAMGFDPGTFTAARMNDWSADFDGIEVANGCGVAGIERSEMLDWYAFLNHGVRKAAQGATDNHKAGRGGLGYPRTYVRMPTDDPKAATVDDFRKAFREGRLVVTCGPFLEAKIGTAEIGDLARVEGNTVSLSVRVAAPTWMDVDQVEVIVNGVEVARMPTTSESAERFNGMIAVPVTAGKDAWLIVKTRGDRRHGIWAGEEPSWAFTNPILLDGDGDGRWEMKTGTR